MLHTSSRRLRSAWLALLFSACSSSGNDGSPCEEECTEDASTDATTMGDAAIDPGADAQVSEMDGSITPDSGADTGTLDCLPDVDSDGDGLSDELECALGSNKNKADTDDDGLSDGVEHAYPRICVATDKTKQRRPVVSCQKSTDCDDGEDCKGIDLLTADSDGDGLLDGAEDKDGNAEFDLTAEETDPRLWDTDGDGLSDKDADFTFCLPASQVVNASHTLGSLQISHDPAFDTTQDVSGTTNSRLGAVLDDATSGVAALIAVAPTERWDVTYDLTAFENAARSQLDPLVPVLVGRAFVTAEGHPGVKATHLYTAPADTSASAVRDLLVPAFTGGTAPGGASAGSGATSFFVDITTVRRSDTLNDVILAVSRVDDYADDSRATAMRVDDLANASGIAAASRVLGDGCQGQVTGSAPPMADLLFMIQTAKGVESGVEDDQDRLGHAADKLFAHMSSAGVDARFGLFQASSGSIDFDPFSKQDGFPNGFQFVSGSDPNGPLLFARYVTEASYSEGGDNAPNFRPFRAVGNGLEPAAAAVTINAEFKRRASLGDTNPNFTLRPGAAKVAFFLTNEPPLSADTTAAAKDWSTSFRSMENPDTGVRFSPSSYYSDKVLDNITKYFQDNELLTYGMLPVKPMRFCEPTDMNLSPLDLPRCVIELNGGGYVDITQATSQTLVDHAIARFATDVAGASASIKLPSAAVSSTLRVKVRGVEVPRSRIDGYEYVPTARTIVFHGDTYRPAEGDAVLVAYRAWKDAP